MRQLIRHFMWQLPECSWISISRLKHPILRDAASLHAKCFEIFDEMINAHNGEPEETLMQILIMSTNLHTYAPKPKGNAGGIANVSSGCEHISDWFIQCIAKYPRLLVKVLNLYIECVVTNPVKTWKTEQCQRSLEYAARYDAALFTKCNESCVEFLCDAIYAEEVMIRSRTIELISRILQLESQVDWQMFRHEVSSIPRELHLIKELIVILRDNNNNIRLRAVQALHAALTRGSPNAQKIMIECLKYARFSDVDVMLPEEPRVRKNEIRYEKPHALQAHYTFEGHGLVELAFMHLPEYLYRYLCQNPLSHIRRAGIMFIEQIAKHNPLVIFNTNFVEEITRLVGEPTPFVRKQTLISVDTILSHYPNCYPVILVWCKIIAPMLHDADPKNVELAIECFRSRVLLNMKGIDQSNKAEHFMPWVIIRTLLSTQSRLYLQTGFHLALQQRMISPQILSIVESHLLTSNSTEAWIVLNFISGKVKNKEPDTLVHMYSSLQSWNIEQNILIALEVLDNCIQYFSPTALNRAFTHILTTIRAGQMQPVMVGKAFDFLLHIDKRSESHVGIAANTNTNTNGNIDNTTEDKSWLLELHEFLEYRLLEEIADFPNNHATFMSYLFSYSEVDVHTGLRPHCTVISFVHKYIRECIKLPENELHLDNERLFNSMILIAGRFSLGDASVASITCTLYGCILKTIDRPPIVNTIIIVLTDLCKKHTQIVERIIERVLSKLSSPFAINRIGTFKCFEILVLQDQLKLRGSLLLALLAAILDDSQELATRAREFFTKFLSKKNPALFQKCLVECPFVLNEYRNFDGLDSFSEAAIKSPLKDESKRKSRQLLYNHLMAEIDDINLVMYFGQLKLIAEKSQNDPLMKSPEGVALIKDVLFILRRVCQLTKANTGDNKDDSENKEDQAATEIAELIAAAEGKDGAVTVTSGSAKTTNATTTGGGRGRRRREVTMADALKILEKSLVFIPTIHRNIHEYEPTVQRYFDDLGKALYNRFPNLIEYAQPTEFWSKYRPAKAALSTDKRKTPKRKSTQKAQQLNEIGQGTDSEEMRESTEINQSDMPDTSNFESDDELPLASSGPLATSALNKRPGTNCTELTMEYLFHPNV